MKRDREEDPFILKQTGTSATFLKEHKAIRLARIENGDLPTNESFMHTSIATCEAGPFIFISIIIPPSATELGCEVGTSFSSLDEAEKFANKLNVDIASIRKKIKKSDYTFLQCPICSVNVIPKDGIKCAACDSTDMFWTKKPKPKDFEIEGKVVDPCVSCFRSKSHNFTAKCNQCGKVTRSTTEDGAIVKKGVLTFD